MPADLQKIAVAFDIAAIHGLEPVKSMTDVIFFREIQIPLMYVIKADNVVKFSAAIDENIDTAVQAIMQRS